LLGGGCGIYLKSFNYFRGISILFIVGGHCISLAGWSIDSLLEKIFVNLIYGGSVLFVFISGFLFHHVFYRNFNYRIFLKKKFENVLTPYLVLSTAPIFYYVFYKGTGSGTYSDYIFLQQEGVYYQYLRPIVMFLWSGATMTAYWYIPFIMIIFLLSPLFIGYIELRPITQIIILGIMVMVSVFMHRPVLNLFPLQSVIYFSPVYIYGILCSIYRDIIFKHLKGKGLFLLIMIFSLAWIQVELFGHYGNFHKSPLRINYPDLLLLQKMIMCIFFMLFFNRFENRKLTILNHLASASFAIYFLHPYLMWVTYYLLLKPLNFLNVSDGLLWLIAFPVVVMASMATARVIKVIFKSYSRQVVGW
jgi:probable poly-beta-1,6-N-acetyl-D-glucosamine export protein